jgi:Z1 domain
MTDIPPIASITISTANSGDPEDMQWRPEPGPELSALLANKLHGNAEAQAQITASARAILGRGVPPGQEGADTGLVVGYVQSGKTLSFTAVMALARDNGFQLVIVIAGSSAQLSDQSKNRIRKDLRIDADNRRAWAPYHNPKVTEKSGIEGLLDAWRDPYVPRQQRQTVVITVMKQHTHLRNLKNLLRGLDLTGVAALVIDDEADQASLNTQAQQAVRLQRARESTTYARLMQMRGALPSLTYLQYTATPQAPLLISIIDSLSARWVDVLEPGSGYTGGVTFFGPVRDRTPNGPPPARPFQHTSIVRTIPASEIPSSSNPITTVPPSLEYALRLFMVGVSAAFARGDAVGGNRSMLVHPSQRTADHQTYLNWINDLFHDWRSALQRGNTDPVADALAETFRVAYDDLAATVGDGMPPFERVKACFRQAFNGTETKEVNRRVGGPPVLIDWGQRFGWILVGGQSMDRGFTVEGLTVTYMPRGLGGGNADTMQQRARFFGYKANYLGYCRVYLERDAKQGFEDYVEHEEFMRNELIRVRNEREPLIEWPRKFVLDPSLKPCRDNVLRDAYSRSAADSDEWITPQAFIGGPGAEQFNRSTVDSFVGGHVFHEDLGHPGRTDTQRHLVTDALPLREVVQGLIADFRIRDPGEAEKWTNLRAHLGRLLEDDANAQAVVYLMSGGSARTRGIYATGRVKQFFQGAAPVNPPNLRGSIYPGDREIKVDGVVTVQVRRLNLTNEQDVVVAEDVPFLAVTLPATGLRPVVFQNQAGQPTAGGGGT